MSGLLAARAPRGAGEARVADIGSAAAGHEGHLFVRGQNVAVAAEDAPVALPAVATVAIPGQPAERRPPARAVAPPPPPRPAGAERGGVRQPPAPPGGAGRPGAATPAAEEATAGVGASTATATVTATGAATATATGAATVAVVVPGAATWKLTVTVAAAARPVLVVQLMVDPLTDGVEVTPAGSVPQAAEPDTGVVPVGAGCRARRHDTPGAARIQPQAPDPRSAARAGRAGYAVSSPCQQPIRPSRRG